MRRRNIVITAAASVVVVVAASVSLALSLHPGSQPSDRAASSADPARPPVTTPKPYAPPTAAEVAALPEAKYSAVISGLLLYQVDAVPKGMTEYSLASDTAVYGATSKAPVARLPQLNFLQQPSVVDVVTVTDGWALALMPSRRALPSASGGNAAAQTAGWVRFSQLTNPQPLTDQIEVSLSKQTLTIVRAGQKDVTYPVGVGAPGTPTPTGVVGYIQARYLDPAQDESVYPIQLTSLHSSAQDEPYGGKDGGLIGVHYNPDRKGAVSHGCIRLPVNAIVAVNALPVGTPIQITK